MSQPVDDTNNNYQGYYYSNKNSNITYTTGDGNHGYFCFKYYRSSSTSAYNSSYTTMSDYAYVDITLMNFTRTSSCNLKYNNTIVNSLKYNGEEVNKVYYNGTGSSNLCYLRSLNLELANFDSSTSSDAQASNSSGFIIASVTGSHGTSDQIVVPYGVIGNMLTIYYEDTVKCQTATTTSSSETTYTYTIKDNWRLVGRDTDGSRYSHGVKG